jgi:hypothetical protein
MAPAKKAKGKDSSKAAAKAAKKDKQASKQAKKDAQAIKGKGKSKDDEEDLEDILERVRNLSGCWILMSFSFSKNGRKLMLSLKRIRVNLLLDERTRASHLVPRGIICG